MQVERRPIKRKAFARKPIKARSKLASLERIWISIAMLFRSRERNCPEFKQFKKTQIFGFALDTTDEELTYNMISINRNAPAQPKRVQVKFVRGWSGRDEHVYGNIKVLNHQKALECMIYVQCSSYTEALMAKFI